MRNRSAIRVSGALMAILLVLGLSFAAHAAPVQAPIIGEIESITIDTPGDHWSGGAIVVGGQSVILPRNLLIDLPANRLTLKQIFDQAPAACVSAGESGLAKGDSCNASGMGGFAMIAANVTSAGNIIAGDVVIHKGIESVAGTVTFINYTDGYLRVNGGALNATQVDDNTGVMIRINDPTGRHTVQQGLGCLPGALNCSADPRFTLDPDNYVIAFSTGYPACIPSTVARNFADVLVPALGTTTAQGLADGTGDILCPDTNRSVNGGQPVDDSRRFAPVRLGDHITATGNFETINCVRFISINNLKVSKQLATKDDASQPDYMFIELAFIEAPGFQDQFIQSHFFGSTTRAPADVVVWSVHNDPVANQEHEFLLATTLGCDAAAGSGTCTAKAVLPAAGADIFSISHIVNFRILPTARIFDPCAHFRSDSRFIPLNVCPAGGTFAEQFSMLSPMPRQIHARTGRNLVTPGLVTLDVHGNSAPNGQYYFQIGMGLGSILLPDFAGIDLDLLDTPISFSGIPWNLDRRLSPAGCDGACEASAQPLDPFPFEGMDPRIQANTPIVPYIDPNFNRGILSTTNDRVLSYVSGVPVGGLFNFDGNNTILAWPPVDPGALPVPVVPPIIPQAPGVSITSFPGFTATQGQLYGYQVLATTPSAVCGQSVYSLDVSPSGMTVSSTGLIEWTPALAQVGSNPVTVRVTDPMGFFDTQSFAVTVDGLADRIGVFSGGLWNLDISGNGAYDGSPSDRTDVFGLGLTGALRVTGDWDGTGTTEIGVYDNGNWFLDMNGNGVWDGEPTDRMAVFGVGLTGAVPVTGDWDGSGATKIGVYSDGLWFLDMNGNGAWDGEPADRVTSFGAGLANAVPVTGNWDGGAATNIGIYADGLWYLDINGSGVWDGEPTDRIAVFGTGLAGAVPVTGDWNGSGTKKAGVFVDGAWYLDFNGNGVWDPAIDTINNFGSAGQNPVSGIWN